MQEIAEVDSLVHYSSVLRGHEEEIGKILGNINLISSLVGSNWRGEAADEFEIQIEEVMQGLKKVVADLGDCQSKLGTIKIAESSEAEEE